MSAIVENTLFRDTFSRAAATLLQGYRWRQPFASMCCPHDHDQQQYMAERLVNVANCTLAHWAASAEGGDQDARVCSAVAALILPVLHAIPNPLPSSNELFDSAEEKKRAARALRAARNNQLDRLIPRPTSPEMVQQARAMGMHIPAGMTAGSIAAPDEPLGCLSDFMADGIGRMLNSTLAGCWHYEKRNSDKMIDAPWMSPVIAAGASAKIVDLMAPFESKIRASTDASGNGPDGAAQAFLFFSKYDHSEAKYDAPCFRVTFFSFGFFLVGVGWC